MDIKYLILDFGKVIAGPSTGSWFITPKFLELIDISKIDVEEFHKQVPSFNYLLDKKILTEDEEYNMFKEFYSSILKSINYTDISEDIINTIAYDFTYTSNKYKLYDNVIDELEQLSKQYKLLLLTDNWPCVLRILKEYDIDKYFDKVYVSSIYDTKKAKKVFFDYPINDYNIKEGEAIFVDDNESLLDIAKEKGLNTRLMVRNNKEVESNHPIIHNLYEIFETAYIRK